MLLRCTSVLFLFFALFSCREHKPVQTEEPEWVSIFNGQDLTGWIPKIKGQRLGQDTLKTFIVEDGLLKVSYKNYDSFNNTFGHLHYKTPFSNYRLKLKYRFVGEQALGGEGWAYKNSGLMAHGQDPKTIGLYQDFPNSLEVQFLGGKNLSETRPTGNLCTPGTHVHMEGKLITEHCISADAPTFYGAEWVEAEFVAYADSLLVHKINGVEVIRYTKPVWDLPDDSLHNNLPIKGGYISLQSESHPIEFKDIMVMVLEQGL